MIYTEQYTTDDETFIGAYGPFTYEACGSGPPYDGAYCNLESVNLGKGISGGAFNFVMTSGPGWSGTMLLNNVVSTSNVDC